ncbi:MAG: hypothetical protein HY296_03150 [Thaumarchaeota archaeon]|nr:hypothetical protein [Nitrososphaerota archaeon]
MKTVASRIATTLILATITLVFTSFVPLQPVSAESVGSWGSAAKYPTNIYAQSCVVSSGYIYCVGGATEANATNAVYYSSLSSSGVPSWTSTTGYPTALSSLSCAASSGYIYCVGGEFVTGQGSSSTINTSYYGSLSSSGVSSWTTTTSYPSTVSGQSCVISSGYIYCVGGYNGKNYTNSVYYAPISSSGVGSWTSTTDYPSTEVGQSCVASGGYIYCVGGYSGTGYLDSVYYAQLSSSGVSTWTSTTAYPITIDAQSCVASGGYIYCVGGYNSENAYTLTNAVYYASLSSSGVSSWTSTTGYLTNIRYQSCVLLSGYIYCVGGSADNGSTDVVYYAQIVPFSSETTTSATAACKEASTQAASNVPQWTVGDFWEYSFSVTLPDTTGGPSHDGSGTSRIEVVGTDTIAVNGNSYETYRLKLLYNLTIEGTTVTLLGDGWQQKSDLSVVKSTLGFNFSGFQLIAAETYSPPQQMRWPLTAGDSWESATVVAVRYNSAENYTQPACVRFMVESPESITVAAGNFTTLPVLKTLTFNGVLTYNGVAETGSGSFLTSFYSYDGGLLAQTYLEYPMGSSSQTQSFWAAEVALLYV